MKVDSPHALEELDGPVRALEKVEWKIRRDQDPADRGKVLGVGEMEEKALRPKVLQHGDPSLTEEICPEVWKLQTFSTLLERAKTGHFV